MNIEDLAMVMAYRPKTSIIQAILINDLLADSAEAARLMGAQSMSLSMDDKSASFTVNSTTEGGPSSTYSAKVGQIIGFQGGTVTVWEAQDFYAAYEPD